MAKPNRVEPIVITSVSADHPLRPHIRPEGTCAALVYGYGSATPTAIRYLGEAWPVKGATWRAA
jgi:hypothetical protein